MISVGVGGVCQIYPWDNLLGGIILPCGRSREFVCTWIFFFHSEIQCYYVRCFIITHPKEEFRAVVFN